MEEFVKNNKQFFDQFKNEDFLTQMKKDIKL